MVYQYVRNENGEFVCQHCQVIKKNQNTMHYHLKKHEGDLPHECKHCKQRFLHLRILNLHIAARHSDEKSDEEQEHFECPHKDCSYSSLTKANRRIHYFRIHMKDIIDKNVKKDDKVYTCLSCNKEMKSQTALYYHVGQCVRLPPTDIRTDELNEVMA